MTDDDTPNQAPPDAEPPPPEAVETDAPAQPKKRGGIGKILLIVGGVIVGLLLIVIAIPFLIPASQYKAEIEKAGTQALARELKINGPLHFTLWPNIGVRAEQVTIANVKGGVAPHFAQIAELDIGVDGPPLLKGDVEVNKLLVKRPMLALEEDVAGKPNWIFGPENPQPTPADAKPSSSPLKKLGFADVRIEDGALTYRDRLGKTNTLSKLNAQSALTDLDQPAKLAADFVYNADPATMTLAIAKPRALTTQSQTPLTLSVKAPKLDLAIDGSLDGKTYAIAGKVNMKGASLRQLSAWTGNPIGPGAGLEAFSVAGDMKMEGQRIDLSNASFVLDAAKGQGTVSILTDPNGKPPYVSGSLALEALDVNPYLGPPQPAAGAKRADGKTPAASPQASGVNVSAPWGNAPLDMSGLRAVNADLNITTKRLLFQNMKLDSSSMAVSIKDGLMNAALHNLALYGGSGSGVLTIDGRATGMKFANRLNVKGINAEAFLTDAMAFNQITGRADIDIDIAGAGKTQQAVMDNLSGRAKFAFANGAVKGVDLEKMTAEIKTALTSKFTGPAARTQFSALSASFILSQGVARTNDGKLESTVVNAPWTGEIGMARQDLKIRVVPTMLRSDLRGLSVPIDVTGPWAKLSFKPDLGAVVKNRVQQEIDKALGGKDLSSILGGKKDENGKTTNPLESLFGKKKN